MAPPMPELRLPPGIDDYPSGEAYDEGVAAPGAPRALYSGVIEALADQDLVELARSTQAEAAARGIEFGSGAPLGVDPVPRLIGASAWHGLETGLEQRAKALNAFLLDAYGDRRIFAAGRIPRRLLETAPGYEPRMQGLLDPAVPPAAVVGPDVVRDPSGALMVLEDNLRMPSGSAYAFALRDLIAGSFPAGLQPRPLASFAAALGDAIRSAVPAAGDGNVAILSDGPQSGAWFEHRALAAALRAPVVVPEELETSGGELYTRLGGARTRIDVA